MGFVRPEGHGGKVLTVVYIAVGCIAPCVPYRCGVFDERTPDDDVLTVEPRLSPVVFPIDAGDLDQVLWAMCTRFDPKVDIDIVQKAWASKRDPLFLPGNFNNRILIDACIPYDMKLKGTFPIVVDVSADLRTKLRAKFPQLFH